MREFRDRLKRYAIIYGVFVKNCFAANLEYRFNFAFGIAVEIAFLLAKLVYVVVVYKTDLHVQGIGPDGILMFIGCYTMMTGFYMGLFYNNFTRIPRYITDGTFDLLLTKPVSLQFITTLRYIDLGMPIPNVIAGLVMVVVGWNAAGLPVTVLSVAGFVWFIVSSLFITYSVMLIPQLLSFWFVNTSAVNPIVHSIWDANNMPMHIYAKWIQRIGTFVIPVFLITNFGPMFVHGQIGAAYGVWSVAAPVILFIIARFIWAKAIRNYSSAGG